MKKVLGISLFIFFCWIGHVNANVTAEQLYKTSFSLESVGNYQAALNPVLKIIRSYPKDYTAVLRAGWLAYKSGKYKSSEHYYRKAVKLKPDSIEALNGLALPLMAQLKWKSVEESLNKLVAKDPNNYTGLSRIAYCLFYQGRYAEARNYYLKTLTLYPSDIEMKLGLGWTYVKTGNKQEAAACFKEVLRVKASNVNALSGMTAVDKL